MSVLITTAYAGTCLSCEESYKAGDKVQWEKGVGSWHKDCAAPRSIRTAQKELQRRRELGLEAHPFGQAPIVLDG